MVAKLQTRRGTRPEWRSLMIFFTVKLFVFLISATMFILTQGIAFQSRFKDHSLIYFVTGVVAFISGCFLIEQLSEKTGYPIAIIDYNRIKQTYLFIENKVEIYIKQALKSDNPASEGQNATGARVNNAPACKECPAIAVINPGSFYMGSSHDATEMPIRLVSIQKPFAIGLYKVTFAEWDACVADGGCKTDRPVDSNNWGRGKRPVINVSWEDAQNYISWLNTKSKDHYRLPSEAEWEYAARAGSKGDYSFEGEINANKANYHDQEVYREKTVDVDMFPRNAFGLYQVHGNVSEWVQDCWTENYTQPRINGSPNETGDCSRRVIRAGSWSDSADRLRSAARGAGFASTRNDRRGFRLARDQ